MKLHFDANIAAKIGLNEAIFIGWLLEEYDETPTRTERLLETFKFWSDEVLYQCLAGLESRKLILVQRTPQGDCIFAINHPQLQAQFGIEIQPVKAPSTGVVLDNNLKKHLLRFQSTDTLLNKKLTQLLQQDTQELLDYAISEGLSHEIAAMSFDKFLHYVSANPDRFWNTDLTSYWRFWVSNSKEKQGISNTGGIAQTGKRSAIERSNDHAASNWLKKKSQPNQTQLHTAVQISHSQSSDTKKPT
ncbi:MAG: hypothetical protein IE914_06600 [Thiotrichales bacterium]|nr:hypothetical protein [Thiotrichales bacterium]